MNNQNQVLYVLGNERDQYALIKYYVFFDYFDVREMKRIIREIKLRYPNASEFYFITNRHGLRYEAKKSFERKSIEDCVIFRDTLQFEGVRINV